MIEGETLEALRSKIGELNLLIGELMPYQFGIFDPKELDLLAADRNARFMKNDMFAQLVANLKKDKALSSIPLVYAGDGGKKVLSGNHRIKAAIVAGVAWIICLVITEQMTEDEQIAVQLSHNSLSGEDDLQVLKRLYGEVKDIELKAYSGLDEETIKSLNAIAFNPIAEPRLKFKSLALLFLPAEVEEIKALAGETDKALKDNDTYAFQVRDYEEFFKVLVAAKGKLNIKNSAVALLELMRIGFSKIEADQVALSDETAGPAETAGPVEKAAA